MKLMYSHVNPKNDKPSPLIAEDVYKIIVEVGAAGHVQLGVHAVHAACFCVEGRHPWCSSGVAAAVTPSRCDTLC
jgi:hypothetical protein